ncbi:endolytic transglycosylase MltG [soil metagenome]
MSERDTIEDPDVAAEPPIVTDGRIASPGDPTGPRAGRSTAARLARSCLPTLVALLVVGGLAAAALLLVFRGADGLRNQFAGPEDFEGDGQGSVTIEVAAGDSAGDIATTLESAGVVASSEAFTDAAAADERSTNIQPGVYGLKEQMSAEAALALLLSPSAKIEETVSIPEGLTAEETVKRLAQQTDISATAYRRAAERPRRLGLPKYAGGNLEGYLFPATYPIPPKVQADDVLQAMVRRFEQAADELKLESGAKKLGYTPAEVVTVASLVQAEAKRQKDFPRVAAVIYNRLDEDQPLQLDSTVQYASGGTSVFTSKKERENPSAYNTYRQPGLPPGPIDAPGEEALKAALDPAAKNWTYFVTVNLKTGKTLYTNSYQQHLRNVEKLRKYCRTSDAC